MAEACYFVISPMDFAAPRKNRQNTKIEKEALFRTGKFWSFFKMKEKIAGTLCKPRTNLLNVEEQSVKIKSRGPFSIASFPSDKNHVHPVFMWFPISRDKG